MLLFARRLRHIARVAEIAGIIAKYGGYHIIDYLGLRDLVPPGIRPPRADADLPSKLRAAIEELGPTFVKLGQVLSTRPDLVPQRYLDELVKLQDTAPPIAFEKIRAVVEEELECPISEAFRYFSETPLAAASLAQAHAAVLQDGTAVVVKVQRPGIRRVVQTDIEIIFDMAHRLMQRWERAQVLNLVDLVEEFQFTTSQELDYLREGRNMDRLRENLKDCRQVHVPAVHWEWSTSRVLTQERIRGSKVTDIEALRARDIDPKEVAQVLGDAYMKMVFMDGFFHADPHPGNVIITDKGVVTLIDFGMVSRMDEGMRDILTRLLISFVEQESRFFAEEILELGRALGDIDRKDFVADVDRMLRRYYDLPARDVNIGELLNATLRLCTEHQIQMPSNFGLVVKVLASLDGITKRLDPDYGYLETARRFLGRAVTERLQWGSLQLDLFRAVNDAKRFFMGLPLRGNQILTKLAEGELRVQFEHKGIEEITRHLDHIGNRLAYAVVVGALLLGSGLFLLAQVPPFIRGYPVVGAATFLVAVVMGIWLLVAILRSGSLR